MRVTVVGGGIAGIATALGLAGRGAAVTVIERAARYEEAGSGLSLWPNAIRALEALGVGDPVRRASRAARRPAIRDAAGRALSVTDVGTLERRFGPLLVIHRADLLQILLDALPGEVRLLRGSAVTSVTPDGTVGHPQAPPRADLVVGADGINSVTRAGVWPEARRPRPLGYGAYRMLTAPTGIVEEGETWGSGDRFGYAPLADGRVYCFASIGGPPGAVPLDLGGLRRRFGRWHAPIPELLGAVPPEALMYHDLYDLPPLREFCRGRVALVGDAAHAMSPDLGQGAGQALEDAVTLAAVVGDSGAAGDGAAGTARVSGALARYDRLRRRRTQAVAARARRVGAVAQRGGAVAALRNLVLRAAPDGVVLRGLAPVLSWEPPR